MTRKKKARTSGQIGIRHKPTAEARQERERPVESKKKGAGLKSGSRNSVHADKATDTGNKNKDPRHGSKTPIQTRPCRSRNSTNIRVHNVATHDKKMHQSKHKRLLELRREGNQGL